MIKEKQNELILNLYVNFELVIYRQKLARTHNSRLARLRILW
ncbi:MAG: hypothetical protein ACI9L6_001276 [Flavobacterium sp.]|jgi:hypothetical protein